MPELGTPAGQDQTDSTTKKNDQVALAERITELSAPQVIVQFSNRIKAAVSAVEF